MRVIFMGTPEFACPSLEAIIKDPGMELVAIYTKEPKIAGRGHKITNTPIHNLAIKHNLKTLTPKTLKTPEEQKTFQDLNPDLAIVVAYGLILPPEILSTPKHGCINIHPSLLPKWRGAAPMQRTIMNGDSETAMTIIKMNEHLDSGDILYQEPMTLKQNITYKSLEKTMSQKGATLITKIAKDFCLGKITPKKQDDNRATYAKKITKEECKIDFNKPAQQVINQINGLSGSLGAYLIHNDEKIKILAADLIDQNSKEGEVGQVLDGQFYIQCQQGIIQPCLVQRTGKRIVTLKDFLLGFNFPDSL